MGETERRRNIQIAHNEKNNITPTTIKKAIRDFSNIKISYERLIKSKAKKSVEYKANKEHIIDDLRKMMEAASKELDFEKAAEIRDIILEIQAD